MTEIFVFWAVSAVAILALAIGLSFVMRPTRPLFGILIDARGRYSLTHFQVVGWSILILSLLSGVFWGRLVDGASDPLGFTIPDQVLGLLGISAGSAVLVTAVKASKDATRPASVAASSDADLPRFSQIFLLEEGEFADKVIDVTKFQNFIITIVLVIAYVGLAINAIEDAGSAEAMSSLPGFSGTFLVLVGISQAAYVAGKVPNQAGAPSGLTLANRADVAANRLPEGFAARRAP